MADPQFSLMGPDPNKQLGFGPQISILMWIIEADLEFSHSFSEVEVDQVLQGN